MATEYESKVTTKLSVDGEAEYKTACKEIKSNLTLLSSEMAVVTAQYKDNADSAEALQAKTDVLKSRYAEQEKQIEATKAQIEKLSSAEGDHSDRITTLEKNLNYQTAALYNTESAIAQAEKATADLENATDELTDSTDESSSSFENFSSIVSSGAQIAVTAIAALGTVAVSAATGLAALTVSGAAYADEILTMSTNTGIATDDLQKYDYALNFIDGDLDTLTGTMEKNTARMYDAAEGNETYAAAYETLGVSIQNADGTFRDSEEVYWEVIDALGQVTDEVERDALATDLLGKSSTDLKTVIEAGSEAFKSYGEEAEAMGVVMSDESLSALGEFDDKVQTLTAGLEGLSNAGAMIALPFLDVLADEGISVLSNFTQGIQDANGDLGAMADVVGETLGDLVGVIAEQLPEFIDMGVSMIDSLVEGISVNLPAIIAAASDILLTLVDGLIELLPTIVEGALQIVVQLAQGIADALPELTPKIVELVVFIVEMLVENLPLLIDAAVQLVVALAEGIVAALPTLVAALPQVISTILAGIVDGLPLIVAGAGDICVAITSGIISTLPTLLSTVPVVISSIATTLFGEMGEMQSVGSYIVQGIWNGISGASSWLWSQISSWADSIVSSIKSAFSINSPSQVMEDEVGIFLGQGVGVGFVNSMDEVSEQMNAAIPRTFDVNTNVTASAYSGTSTTASSASDLAYAGSINIYVYGAQGQSETAIAEIVMKKINEATQRKVGAFA